MGGRDIPAAIATTAMGIDAAALPSDCPAHEPKSRTVLGTRCVERTLWLLKTLSTRGEFGWRLSDLAEQAGLDRATCHRMLTCLVKEGYAQRFPQDVKYYPGQVLFEMGLALPEYAHFRELTAPRLEQVAASTGCIASLSLRSGNDTVCIAQNRSRADLAGMLIRVGSRRPLFAAVAGLAILQLLAPDERSRIIEENTQREVRSRGSSRLKDLARMRERSAAAGFGYTVSDLAPGITAMGVAIRDAHGRPFAGLTLTGSNATLHENAIAGHHEQMLDAVAAIEADARQALRPPAHVGGY